MSELTQEDIDAVFEKTFLVPCHLHITKDGTIYDAVSDISSMVGKRVRIERHGSEVTAVLEVIQHEVIAGVTRFKMTPVESSNIKAVGYIEGMLLVEFSSGGFYRYDGVPVRTHDALLSSRSKGSFLAEHIKKRFAYEKVEAKPV